MKILIVQETDWIERNPVHQHHLAEKLSLKGHEVRVIDYEILWRKQNKRELFSKRKVFAKVTKIYPGARVTVIRPGIVKLPLLNYASLLFSHQKEIKRQMKEFQPDVIVGFGIINSYLALRAAKQKHIPFIYYWIDALDRLVPFAPFRLLARYVERKTLRQASRVLAINEQLKDYVLKLGASPERTCVLKPGINTAQFTPRADGDIRRQYGLSEKDTVLLFMGWLYSFSGLKEVALDLARAKNSQFKLMVVGDGDAYDELQTLQQDYNLKGKLILTGKKTYSEIPGFIASSDICLLPAYPDEPVMQDIVPIKMYEYMAMKKPVIATRLPGLLREFGEDNGVVYVNSPDGVISKAREVLPFATTLGSKARDFVQKYSWDSITAEFEVILKEAIQKQKGTK